MASTAKTLGELMKEHRNRLQLTQEEVAEMIDCHPQYYKKYESIVEPAGAKGHKIPLPTKRGF